jgi:hypothetical protein
MRLLQKPRARAVHQIARLRPYKTRHFGGAFRSIMRKREVLRHVRSMRAEPDARRYDPRAGLVVETRLRG